jgi:hypothetical protein
VRVPGVLIPTERAPPPARLALGLLVLGLLVPTSAAAQQIQGRVLDREDQPVPGATVTLEDSTGEVLRSVVADDGGRFWLWHTEAGDFRLSAERIGYAPVLGQPVRLEPGEVVRVELRMEPQAVPLEPLRVLTRREVTRYTPDEFYDRMGRLDDRGSFVTRDEIDDSGARLPSSVVASVAGTWVEPGGRSRFTNTIQLMSYGRVCTPKIFLNGHPLPDGTTLDDAVMVDRIEGVEIYRGQFVPAGYHHDPATAGCGVVLVWTRPEPDPRFAFSWSRTILFGVLGGLLFGVTSLAF